MVNVKNYQAEILWLEPFATKKMQTLYSELQSWQYKGSPCQYLFVSAIPQKPDKTLWNTLRTIRVSVAIQSKQKE